MVIEEFGNFDKLVLEAPPSVDELLIIALEENGKGV